MAIGVKTLVQTKRDELRPAEDIEMRKTGGLRGRRRPGPAPQMGKRQRKM